jgi:hypothetical protein
MDGKAGLRGDGTGDACGDGERDRDRDRAYRPRAVGDPERGTGASGAATGDGSRSLLEPCVSETDPSRGCRSHPTPPPGHRQALHERTHPKAHAHHGFVLNTLAQGARL